jgi:hypothetical protein
MYSSPETSVNLYWTARLTTVKPRFIVFVGGPEKKNDGCGKTIDAGPI